MKNTEMNKQLQEFLAEYANGNVMLADGGAIEEIEQSNQHFILTITHKVLTSDIVQYITFKQHENYTHGDDYNELSDVFDYENVFRVTMIDDEVIEIEEKTKEQVILKSTSTTMLSEILYSFLINKNIDSNIITINTFNKFGELYPIEITKGKNELLYRIKLSDNDHTYWVSLNSKDEIIEMLRRNSY